MDLAVVLRRTLVAICLLSAAVALAWAGPPSAALGDYAAPPTADALIAGVAALTAWLVLAWLVVVGLVTTVASLPGSSGRIAGALARRLAPATVRRALEAALGVALTVGATSPAAAMTTARDRPAVSVQRAVGDRVSFGHVEVDAAPIDFDRPHSPVTRAPVAPAAPRTAPPPLTVVTGAARDIAAPDANDVIVVRRGDSLWSIAERALGAGASADEVDVQWRSWYAANRAAIGPDPHLIRPGLLLSPPGSPAGPTP